MLLLLIQLMMLSSPFGMKLLLLLLDIEEEVLVVELSQGVFIRRDFRNGFVGLILCYLIARDV